MRINFYIGLGMVGLFLLTACGDVERDADQGNEAVETQEIGAVHVENEIDTANPDNENELDDEGSAESMNVIAEIDRCLIGSWEVDDESLIAYLSSKMNISEEIKFEMEIIEGNLVWEFDQDGIMRMMSDQDLLIVVDIIANEVKLGTANIAIDAWGEADYVNYGDGLLVSAGGDYEVGGESSFQLDSSQLMSSGASIMLTPGLFTSSLEGSDQEIIISDDILEGEADGYTFYTCDTDQATLQIEFGEDTPLKFYKIVD